MPSIGEPPDPGPAKSLDDVVERLRLLRAWAGNPSYESIKDRVTVAWTAAGRPPADRPGKTTIVDCFRRGRRRLNPDLVMAVVQALHPDVGYAAQWRQALRVAGGTAEAAAQVRVQDKLPPELAGFTGREAELRRLAGADGVSVIAGMAGVGKTQLAIRAGHLLARERSFEHVLFVNLRGFDPDPAQPPADPAAVLDGFLRLLGIPGHRIPHDLAGRMAAFRDRLAGVRALVVLDNAARAEQVGPLLPGTPGSTVIITSRRSLTDVPGAEHLAVDVFSPDEAEAFLIRAAPDIPAGPDPLAPARIAGRCGYLPLALGLIAGHIGTTPGWTLTDHADRLDERRLGTGVQLAFDCSYQHLTSDQRRVLRLGALHPGQDLDAYAVSALAEIDLPAARAALRELARDHLLQPTAPGRYGFHDLVRHHAAEMAGDHDPPSGRRSALTRLFDYYLAASGTAMDVLYPAEAYHRPKVGVPETPVPDLADPDTALGWLDAERPTLVAVAAHTATEGWPAHTSRLSTILYRYLDGGHSTDALTLHDHARRAAEQTGDHAGHAHALNGLGTAHLRLGQYGSATDHFRRALILFRATDDPAGQARVLGSLGNIDRRSGRLPAAMAHHEQARRLFQRAGDQAGEARALRNRGIAEVALGRDRDALDHFRRALELCSAAGDRTGEADALQSLGGAEARLGQVERGVEHLERAADLFQQLGNPAGRAWALHHLGKVHLGLGRPGRAAELHRAALSLHRRTDDQVGIAAELNGLGAAALAAGDPAGALTEHREAYAVAVAIDDRYQQAHAQAGLGRAHAARDDEPTARALFELALALYTALDAAEAGPIRDRLSSPSP
jgi:tetratricopeptide (TPR) repeat protein